MSHISSNIKRKLVDPSREYSDRPLQPNRFGEVLISSISRIVKCPYPRAQNSTVSLSQDHSQVLSGMKVTWLLVLEIFGQLLQLNIHEHKWLEMSVTEVSHK